MEKNMKKYYLGFDIGTASIGWAVTDENYEILKFNGKNMWGSRLFDKANTAAERRMLRTGRRRCERRRWRLLLLQELFAKEILPKYPDFFLRLKESALLTDDRTHNGKPGIFDDPTFKDRDYYKLYPTVFHLRKALIDGHTEDIRLLYIAIHHIMKHRGHFLFNSTADNVTSFEKIYEELRDMLRDEFEVEIENGAVEKLESILKDKELPKTKKREEVLASLNIDKKNKQCKAIIGLICGRTENLSDIFDREELKEFEKNKISFSNEVYEEVRPLLEEELAENCVVIDTLKKVYDWTVLSDILSGGEYEGKSYISMAKVKSFDKHRCDLEILKKVLSDYPDLKRKILKGKKSPSYATLIGSTGGKSLKRCRREDFEKELKKTLISLDATEESKDNIDYILHEMDRGTFLPLQVSIDNSVVPYQLQESELKVILDNHKDVFPLLNETDEKGVSVADKIISLLTFRVPYYVGPLGSDSPYAWAVRKEEGKITPWNFEDKVDLDMSAEKFIRRMTNKCTYLYAEDVVPKYSLAYCRFTVLNELNNVKVEGKSPEIGIKQKAFVSLFQNRKKVSGKMIADFLKSEGYEVPDNKVGGIDGDFKSSLASYLDFKKIFGAKVEEYDCQMMIENLILWITLYGEDKRMLRRVIRKNYDEGSISDEKLKKICRLKYQGWGRLSRRFLCDLEFYDKTTGEIMTVLQGLWNTNNNLMQLFSQTYTLAEEVRKENAILTGENTVLTYDGLVKDLPGSPAIKRSIWQTIKLVKEIEKIAGNPPGKIFVEVSRWDDLKGDAGRKKSRKTELLEAYEAIKDEEIDWKNEIENRKESDFRSIKLYLYYTQMGRCMYTGEKIDLSEIANTDIYDRDHIFPQSKTKDDSLDNRVLVKKSANQEKKDKLIDPQIQQKMAPFWRMLRSKNLISENKLSRLLRNTPLTDEELAGFINRQLVEARQSSRLAIQVLQQIYPASKIVFVKAKLVSEFRTDHLKMVKVRSLNDYHHAKDAYLNIVVGNVYYARFTSNPLEWLKKNKDYNYSLDKVFDFDVAVGGKSVWKKGDDGTLSVVRRNMLKKDIRCTRQVIQNKGELFNQQIVKKTDHPSVEIKKGMSVTKYGGYKSLNTAYFCLIEYSDAKGIRRRRIEPVPLLIKEKISDISVLKNYFEELGFADVDIRMAEIKKNTLFYIDGFYLTLRGISGKSQLAMCNAVQLMVDEQSELYLKKLEKYIERNKLRKDKKILLQITEKEGISAAENIKIYNLIIDKLENTIYKNRPASSAKWFVEKEKVFAMLSLEEQCITLNEIMTLMRCKPDFSNLALIGGSKYAGKTLKNRDIHDTKECYIITQSVTGLFEKKIDLKTI